MFIMAMTHASDDMELETVPLDMCTGRAEAPVVGAVGYTGKEVHPGRGNRSAHTHVGHISILNTLTRMIHSDTETP